MIARVPWRACAILAAVASVLAWMRWRAEAAGAGAVPAELARRALTRAKRNRVEASELRAEADALDASGEPELDAAADAQETGERGRIARGGGG